VTPAGARRPVDLFAAAAGGDRTAKARLLSLIERGGDAARDIGRLAAPLAGEASTIGLTGAPGAGKSTLTSALITHLRRRGEEVAVLAVDPSSPFTGGAILGDRVRMQDHATDPGVFIRSMATRGHLGGLALATPEAIRLLDALGHRWIIVETVGVGQVEVEVAGRADTTVVVVNPGWGDSVQASKAGLMEVADVFAINKADRAGVEETRRDLQQMLELAADTAAPTMAGWPVPIVPTVASSGDGVPALWDAVIAHRDHMHATGVLDERRRYRLGEELREIVARRLAARAREVCTGERWDELTDAVLARDVDPWAAADEMLAPVLAVTVDPDGQRATGGSGSVTPAGAPARR
jgi:LAO/AO transport system kinase